MTTVIAPFSITPRTATAGQVRTLVERCTPRSLQQRFFLPAAPQPIEVLARYGRYLLAGPPDGAAVVAMVDDRPVGLLNLVVVGDGFAEMGLLVVDDWQRRGVATHLLDVELGRPRWAGWTVHATVRADNPAARRLLGDPAWGRCRRVVADGPELTYEIDVPRVARV